MEHHPLFLSQSVMLQPVLTKLNFDFLLAILTLTRGKL